MTRLVNEIICHTKHVLVISAGLPSQSSCFMQKMLTQCFGKEYVDGCSWILHGTCGTFIYKYLLNHVKEKAAKSYNKQAAIQSCIVIICSRLTSTIIIIIILAVHATAGRWPPQPAPCTSILGRSHPLTANGFLDVISPSPFGSSS